MANLIAAAGFFVLIHLLVSGTRMRDGLVARLGAGPYMGLFSLVSVLGLVWLGFAFGEARTSSWNTAYWAPGSTTRGAQLLFQLLALLLIFPGLTTPNPTSVRQEGALQRPDVVKGMLRITRHPFLWGVAIWALGHLLVNGEWASLILFGSMFALAVFGTLSIDAKRKRALGPEWDAFVAQTSNVPFAAILSGRQKLNLEEVGWWRVLVATLLWAGIAWSHQLLFGVPAIPS
ncbi:NnrU family protein [Phenylobacterium kunshanense]|uniref:NnrU family protein n=1 Tax=Phenylobacterium kunshanense TaxID=1445034 RepID=A0A328BAG8_9CAUL|nr:NnrU family protein [Phenylobacterium kunshanense]RAK62028.1 NnrU family protein [Phenylobacterium kunshanense]